MGPLVAWRHLVVELRTRTCVLLLFSFLRTATVLQAVHETNLEFPKWYLDRKGKHLIRGALIRCGRGK